MLHLSKVHFSHSHIKLSTTSQFKPQPHNSNHNPTNWNTHGIIQQQEHLTTSTTSFRHKFINNQHNKTILHQFEQKSTKSHITLIQTCKSNNMFNINFTYLNLVSKWVHEIHVLNSQKNTIHKISTYGNKLKKRL